MSSRSFDRIRRKIESLEKKIKDGKLDKVNQKLENKIKELSNKNKEFNHAEAFCLMIYECVTCGHKIRIWNSRDGVTPFVTSCTNCEEGVMSHSDWNKDIRILTWPMIKGDKFWRDGTHEEAVEFMKRRIELFQKNYPLSEEVKTQLFDEIINGKNHEFKEGWPMLDTFKG